MFTLIMLIFGLIVKKRSLYIQHLMYIWKTTACAAIRKLMFVAILRCCSTPYKEMSDVIKSRHSSITRWRTITRCRIEGREDYGVTYLMTLAQEQSWKLLMHCHVHGSLVLQRKFKCMGHHLNPKYCTPGVYLGSFNISK